MVNSDKFLYNKVELQAPIEVTIANGEKVLALYTGEITLEVTVNRNKEQVLLRNVLYSPQIQCNLLSEGRADDAGASITKSKGKCSIKHYETGETILTATKVGSLYQVNGHAICMEAKAMVASISHTNNLQKWHHRMGHISSLRLKQLNKVAEGVEVDKSAELPPCDDCALGKMTRAPFKTLDGEERHIETLSRVHSDLYGPLEVQTAGGKQYAQIVVDVGSSWRKGYCLTHKSEAPQCIEAFQRYSKEVHPDKKIGTLVTDNGGEFVNATMGQVLEKDSTRHQTTQPYTPQQNGIAERSNRTVFDMVRTMLLSSGLPKCYWGEAFNTAIYVINRSPTKSLQGRTPFEVWYGRKPSLRHLRVFGCLAYAHVPKQKRSKLEAHGMKCVMLGYASTQRGYQLLELQNKEVIETRDVRFHEDNFPFKKDKHPATSDPEGALVIPYFELQEPQQLEAIENAEDNKVVPGGAPERT
jgi:transposase InsO family protein